MIFFSWGGPIKICPFFNGAPAERQMSLFWPTFPISAIYFLSSSPWVLSKSRSQEPILIFTWRTVQIFFSHSFCPVTQCKTTKKVHMWFQAMKQQKKHFFPTTLQSVLFRLRLGSGSEPFSEGRPTPDSPVSEAGNVWHGHGHWREDVWRLRGPQRHVSFSFHNPFVWRFVLKAAAYLFYRGLIFAALEPDWNVVFIVLIEQWTPLADNILLE